MTEENAPSAAAADVASAKKGGSQFIMKMVFLALIVLAIVFYVRSLDHEIPASESTGGEAAPAPAATEHTSPALPPAVTPPPAPVVQPSPAQEPPAVPQVVAPAPQSAAPSAAPEAAEPRFRPLTEAEVLRQIQETFAPETLEAPAGN